MLLRIPMICVIDEIDLWLCQKDIDRKRSPLYMCSSWSAMVGMSHDMHVVNHRLGMGVSSQINAWLRKESKGSIFRWSFLLSFWR